MSKESEIKPRLAVIYSLLDKAKAFMPGTTSDLFVFVQRVVENLTKPGIWQRLMHDEK